MVFNGVQDVIGQCSGFDHRVNSRLQVLHQNLTAVLGGTVNGTAGVPDGGNAEGHTIQERTVRAGFHQSETGLFGVCEDKFSTVICF